MLDDADDSCAPATGTPLLWGATNDTTAQPIIRVQSNGMYTILHNHRDGNAKLENIQVSQPKEWKCKCKRESGPGK